jgi:hypothetical protein
MRILLALVVGVIGCGVTYVVATRLGAIGEIVMGPMLGSILGIIVALGGLAVTLALAYGAAKPRKTSSS